MLGRRALPARFPKSLVPLPFAALPLMLAIGLAPTTAAAAEPPSSGAERLFADGLKLAHGGDCAHARDKFTESYAADPAPGTLINWALCEEKLGRLATALELFRLADQALPASHPKRTGMAKHLEELAKRAPLLRLRMTFALPVGATVMMDGATVETTSTSLSRGLLRDPGQHVIELRVPGREDRRYEVTLAEATTLEITVEPGAPRASASSPGATPASGAAVPSAATASPSAPSSTLGWALAGSGLAVLGVGAVTGLLANGQWHEVEQSCDVNLKVCPTDAGLQASRGGETLATVSTVAFIAGGVSFAVGGYLLLTKKDAPAIARVSAAAGPALVGLRLAGEF